MSRRLLLILTLCLAFVALSSGAANTKFTLVIDPGHGGNDAGAKGAFSYEKNINLKVALAFGKYVERNCPDVKVIYTRKTDVFIPLHRRADIANRNKADLFVSVHTNALPGGKVGRGMETYTLGMHRAGDNLDVAKRENEVILIEKDYKQRYQGFDPRSSESYIMFEFIQDKNMAKSVDMAKFVQQTVCPSVGRPNKGVKQAGFLVLRETSMPSCLIELGFITTSDEERLLNDAGKVDAIGKGIYQAFVKYKKKYNEGLNVPFRETAEENVSLPSVVPEESNRRAEQRQEERREKQATPDQRPTERNQQPSLELQPNQEPQPSREPQPSQEQNASLNSQYTIFDLQSDPVFKVQIMASDTKLKKGDRRFKGVTDYDCYEENRLYKYTVGASTDYNAIYQQRKSLLNLFPEAFIIAFRNGEKMDVREAIRLYRAKKK